MLVGIPRGGKGTIVRLMTDVVGKENVHAVRLGQLTGRFSLQGTIGKSLLLIPDAKLPKGDKQPEIVELIKAITGRDMVNIDRKNLAMVSMTLPLKIVITSNDLLALPDDSSALYKRMLTLQFTESFEHQIDLDLDAKLQAELPGIALWAVTGWKRLKDSGRFTDSRSGQAMTKKLEDAANPIVAFRDDRCMVDPNATILKDDLFDEWVSWCQENELPPGNKNTFSAKLYSACPSVGDSRPTINGQRIPHYRGIALSEAKAEQEKSSIRLGAFPDESPTEKSELSQSA